MTDDDRTDEVAFAATEAAPSATRKAVAVLEAGEVVGGRFVVAKLLGEGTFGWVFAADDRETSTRVALKVLRPEHAADGAIVARFKRRELELLRRVHANGPHSNVVSAVEPALLTHGDYLVLVLEFIDGDALDQVITRERMLDQREARAIAAGLARGLQAIHAAGGVHRDLKPANIRLRRDGEPVILDLGIARAMWETQTLTGTGQFLMTPLYASPEQLGGGEVGPPADIYALGLILFEMLTGVVPLAGRTYVETFTARSSRDPPDPRATGRSLDDSIVALTVGCLAREPHKRPGAAAVVEALASGGARKRQSRAYLLASAGGALLVAVAALGGLLLHRSSPTRAPVPTPLVEKPTVQESGRALPGAPAQPTPIVVKADRLLGIDVEVSPKQVVDRKSLRVRVRVAHSGYLVLVGVGSDGEATVVAPQKNAPLAIGPVKPTEFPNIKVQLLPKQSEAMELMIALGTRDSRVSGPILQAFRRGHFRMHGNAAVEEQLRAYLSNLPADQFEIATASYRIVRK